MGIKTYPVFYFGTVVTLDARTIDFDEGSGPITATLQIGTYPLSRFVNEIARAMNQVGLNDYVVSVNRESRSITISASDDFDLLVATGTSVGTSILPLAGFVGADRTGNDSYTGGPSGLEYTPQFLPQDYVSFDDFQEKNEARVNISSSGVVETVGFGALRKMEMNLTYNTDTPQDFASPIRNNPNGVLDLRTFMLFATSKGEMEFMEDEDNRNNFEIILLDRTRTKSDGTGFRLRELYNRGLFGYYETGLLTFRQVVD